MSGRQKFTQITWFFEWLRDDWTPWAYHWLTPPRRRASWWAMQVHVAKSQHARLFIQDSSLDKSTADCNVNIELVILKLWF